MSGTISTATVETLTATVRVLMVGSRQVTLSVFKQLDMIDDLNNLAPMGRVRFHDPDAMNEDGYPEGIDQLWLVGTEKDSGHLVRAHVSRPVWPSPRDRYGKGWSHEQALEAYETHSLPEYMRYKELPLIILAGLR